MFLAITTSSLAPFIPCATALAAAPGIRISAPYFPMKVNRRKRWIFIVGRY